MPDESRRAFAVTVAGLIRGLDLSGPARLVLRDDAIELALHSRVVTVPLAELEGLGVLGSGVELHLASGDAVQVAGEPPDTGVALAIARHAYALPEVTRSLRAMGSRRAAPGAVHDRLFAPLLAARRRAEMLADPFDRARALEAAALRGAVERLLAELAAERFGSRSPERRALEAELRECAGGLFARLDLLAREERALRVSDDRVRLARWRAWVEALHGVFEGADACLGALGPALERERPPAPRWRRWLGMGRTG
ncbi:MAG TPA: hypothetical protein VFS05_10970 [Gemmatimonadaceae bacterium]|nr:hypothetical protein [Gemmatimonadaceae bacterium]